MINKKFDGQTSQPTAEGQKIIEWAQGKSEEIAKLYEELNFAKAMVEVREIADKANQYFDEKAPWKLIKEDPETTKAILTDILAIFSIMAIYLKPIMPEYAQKVEKLFGFEDLSWSDVNFERIGSQLFDTQLNAFEYLSQRVDGKKVEELIEASKA